MDAISTPQRSNYGQRLDAASQMSPALAARSPPIFSEPAISLSVGSDRHASATTEPPQMGQNGLASRNGVNQSGAASPNMNDSERPGNREASPLDVDRDHAGSGPARESAEEQRLHMAQLHAEKNQIRSFREQMFVLSKENSWPTGNQSTSAVDTPTEPPTSRRSFSPAWSSDSDNRLIKGVSIGKSLDLLENEFPARNKTALQKRAEFLFRRDSLGQDEQATALPAPTGIDGADRRNSNEDLVGHALGEDPAEPAADTDIADTVTEEPLLAELAVEEQPESPANGNTIDTLADEDVSRSSYGGSSSKDVAEPSFLASILGKDRSELHASGNAINTLAGESPLQTSDHGSVTWTPRNDAHPMSPDGSSGKEPAPTLTDTPSSNLSHMPKKIRQWTSTEDDLVKAGVKAGKTLEVMAQKLPERSVGAVKQRLLRLVEVHAITETERLATLSASRPQTHEATAQPYTEEEDEIIAAGVNAGHPVHIIAQRLNGRTLVAVKQRLYRLMHRGKITKTYKASLPSLAAYQVPQAWTQEEDELVAARVKAGETADRLLKLLSGRTWNAVKKRLYRLVETGKITEAEKVNFLTSTTYRDARDWTTAEDDTVSTSVKAGKSLSNIRKLLIGRSTDTISARLPMLVEMGKLTETERRTYLNSLGEEVTGPDARNWTEEEDNVILAGIKARETQEAVTLEFAGRTIGGIKSRCLQLAEQGKITEAEKLAFFAALDPQFSTQDARIWTKEENDILSTGLRTGETPEDLAKKLNGRTVAAIKARIWRVDGLKTIVAKNKRRAGGSGSNGPVYSNTPAWTTKEDALLIRGIDEGKTAAQTANTLPMRSEGAVVRRRQALIHSGQVGVGEHFSGSSSYRSPNTTIDARASSEAALWTDQDDDLLRKYKAQRLGWAEISILLKNRSASAVQNRWNRLHGSKETAIRRDSTTIKASAPPRVPSNSTTPKVAGLPWTEEEDRKLVKLYNEGYGWTSMAGQFGDRSTGSFPNRYNLLMARGRLKELEAAANSSEQDSADDRRATGVARPHDKAKYSSVVRSKRKRLEDDDSEDAASPRGMIKVMRKRAPMLPIPHPDTSDSSDDEAFCNVEDDSASHRNHAVPTTSRGGRLMRGVSRPLSSAHRQVSGGITRSGQRNNDRYEPLTNSVDRLSTLLNAADDGETIHVSSIPGDSTTRHESSAKWRRTHGGASVMGRVDGARQSPAFNARASVQMDDRELNATITAQREEIRDLKARLAKFEEVARQNRQIAELRKQLDRYTHDQSA